VRCGPFKSVNDSLGHQAGDEVLFARLLMGSMRKGLDWVARYGGEEFLIVLPETCVADAMVFAEKMRALVAAHPFEITDATLSVSASFGVAGFDSLEVRGDLSVDRLIGHADSLPGWKGVGARERVRVSGRLFGILRTITVKIR
jgi:two-component system, cell cycle response regulator